MGNSGFFNDGSQTIVYADNIDLGGSGTGSSPMFTTDGQLMIGSTTTPHVKVATLSGSGGVVVTNGAGAINLSFDPKLADPSVISTVFQANSISDVIECTSIFNSSNIDNIASGDEVLKLSVTPSYANSVLTITSYIIASRREGNIGVSLVQAGVATPLCFSLGYSAGYPNLCTLFYVLPVTEIKKIDLSIRVGGIDSGPVVINGLPNKTKLLSKTLTSYCVIQESVKQTP